MSEKDKLDNLDDENIVEEELEEAEESEEIEEQPSKASAVTSRYPDRDREKKEKEKEKDKKKGKKEFFLVRFGKWAGRKIRDLIAELKKVTWPGFPKVMKQTGIVIGVVLFLLVIIFVIDLGLSQLYQLLVKALNA